MAARIKLGELLVRAGVLDEFKLKAALTEQQKWGGRLGRILVEMNFVSEDLLVKALSKQLGIPRAKLQNVDVPNEVLGKIDPQFASQNAVCPERYIADKKTLVIAMSDPTNVNAIDELRFKTGLRIETSLAGELEIGQTIDRVFYGRAPIDGIDIAQIERSGAAGLFNGSSGSAFEENGNSTRMSESAPPTMPPFSMTQAPPTPMNLQSIANNPMGSGLPTFPSMPPVTQPYPTLPPMPPPFQPRNASPPPLPQTRERGPSTTALEMAVALDGAQKKQLKAIRVLLELLIEKGVFSRDEYMALVNRR